MEKENLSKRTIMPGEKLKGRGNPKLSLLVQKNIIQETATDIVLHKDGTFEVKEGSIK